MDNALLLVVGYTDSTGSQELNQELSEKRAGRVVNHLQQACGWKPYRMLSPTGMAEADPAADNSTPEGKAQNRRVAVNIMVSKGLRSEEHTSELQSLMRISYAVFCFKKKKPKPQQSTTNNKHTRQTIRTKT